MFRTLIFFCFLLLPSAASASVYISEVAWMGSLSSANHEWIELHNSGGAVDVTGWTLVDSNNLSIVLTGTLSSNTHVVLERTSDASAPGSAFVVYVGALVNTGTTITLLRADGAVADQVSGGEDWDSIGGDNTTKETAQYSSSGWVTAVATPGRAVSSSDIGTINVEIKESQTGDDSSTSNSSAQKSSSRESVRLTIPDVTLRVAIDVQSIGYVHQAITFEAIPSNVGDTLIDSLVYSWNFGDGMTAESKKVDHIFNFPGTYIVNVYANFKRQEQVARHEITILPVTISLTKNTHGDVQVHNDAQYEVDISGYRLRAQEVFIFPDRSIVLPSQTITIPKEMLGKTESKLVGIYDTQGVLLHTMMPSAVYLAHKEIVQEVAVAPQPVRQISALSTSRSPVQDNSAFGFNQRVAVAPDKDQAQVLANDADQEEEVITSPIDNQLASAVSSSASLPAQWPYFALGLLLILSTVGIFATAKRDEAPE